MSDPIVGIDLGTSNSVVAHADAAGNVTVLADAAGNKVHPSVVSFHPSGGVVVGAAAKQRKVIDPQNTIYSVKRLIGRSYDSPEVQTAKTRAPFQIKEGPSGAPLIVTRGGEFAVPEVSAIVLDHVRNIAAERLAAPVSRAVITVPASFNDAQRSATATAGAIAGLTVVRVLNEPTAAALAYGHSRKLHEIIAVYDFGGGTFDITLLRLEDQVYEVLGTSGDTFLGGDDLDERLVDKMVAKFLVENRIDLRNNEIAMMRLRAVSEQTKIELSRRSRAVVRVDEIAYGPRGAPLNLQIEISRDELVHQIAELVDRTFPVCSEALALAQLSADRISDVILVGGTTKIPYVRDQVGRFFGKPPRTDVNPEDAVAAGAALQATSLERILSRRTSARVTVPPAPAPARPVTNDEPSGETRVAAAPEPAAAPAPPRAPSEPPRADPERPRRMTADYAATSPRPATDPTRPNTGYSVNRARIRDEAPGPPRRGSTPIPVSFEDRTPPSGQTQPIARITRPAAAQPAPRPTLLGVPAAPAEVELASASAAAPPARLPTASPPPVPRGAGRAATVHPAQPPHQTHVPVATIPMAPVPPVDDRWPAGGAVPPSNGWARGSASPSAAETLRDLPSGATAPGLGPPALSDPSPASTFRGFDPPRPAAAMPAPPRPSPVLLEVTPRGLGIATVAGFCEELLRRNARLPAETRKLFTTSRDLQDAVRIVVCQGESRRLDKNTVIGDLVLQGLPPRPRGETTIEVTFTLDASGVLHVSARDAATGAEQRASLDLVGGLAQGDVAASRERLQRLRG